MQLIKGSDFLWILILGYLHVHVLMWPSALAKVAKIRFMHFHVETKNLNKLRVAYYCEWRIIIYNNFGYYP